MKRKEGFLPVFFVVTFLCILILVLSLAGKLNFLSSFLEKGTSGVQGFTYSLFQKMPFVAENSTITKLKDDNLNLLNKIADNEKLQRENAALSDQFQTSYPASSQLLEAQIIGVPGFIPGISLPANFILNKGSKGNVKVGQAVVIGNNLVGKISKTSTNLSEVTLVNNSSFSFTAKTESGAQGIIKGGVNLTFDNVLLSENLKISEIILTKGDVNQDGIGIPPDLIVGKIKSVEKNPSDLFQKAKVESFIDFNKLSTVFIYLGSQ